MLKLLVKKQLAEVFRAYLYDAKKNKKRSKGSTALWILFFAVIMVGVLGSMFTFFAKSLCPGLTAAGMDWLYFLIMTGASVFLGAFGSVFNTFSGLYLAKDNDLLLSMPIPEKYIIASRLTNVYLLGAMYSLVAIVPSIIVYWIYAEITALRVICAVLLLFIITFFVLVLSCLLGWVVAKISLKLKRKSFVTVLVSLLFVGGYYFFYFKAQALITDIIQNAAAYGEKIKGAAFAVYMLGCVGCGNIKYTLIYLAATAAAVLLTWIVLKNTFISIATASSKTEKKRSRKSGYKQKSAFETLFSKELSRFTSSPNYMLNCGMGILFGVAMGIALLVKGDLLMAQLSAVFAEQPGCLPLLLCALIFTLTSANDIVAPSVSLEGKSIWIPQSLPVSGKTCLQAKSAVQLALTAVPVAFALVCSLTVLRADMLTTVLICVICVAYLLFSTAFGSLLSILMPNLNWTNEVTPIKQSASVMIALFGGLGFAGAFALIYMLAVYDLISLPAYLGIWSVFFTAAGAIMYRYVCTKGAEKFERL